MPPNPTITGIETITYFNNNPDSIHTPSIKLFVNIHKPGAPRDVPAQEDYLTSGIHIDAITINGEKIDSRADEGTFTNLTLHLPKPLAPKDSMQLEFSMAL